MRANLYHTQVFVGTCKECRNPCCIKAYEKSRQGFKEQHDFSIISMPHAISSCHDSYLLADMTAENVELACQGTKHLREGSLLSSYVRAPFSHYPLGISMPSRKSWIEAAYYLSSRLFSWHSSTTASPPHVPFPRLSPLNVTQVTREIAIHTQVQSRCNNIIRLFAFWETDTHYYVVMERASQDLHR